MALDRRKLLLFGAACLIRLVLFVGFPSLPDLLTGRVEISTPVTSFKRLQEGVFLYTHNVSPYDGGVYHQSPLFLTLFASIPSTLSPILVPILYICLDLLCAYAIIEIAESKQSGNERLYKSPRRELRTDSLAIGAGYLLNPLTIASCLGRSTNIFTNCAILFTLLKAIEGNTFNAMMALALATHFSMYPVLLLPPVILLAYDQHWRGAKEGPTPLSFSLKCLSTFAVASTAFAFMAYIATGFSWEFLVSTYGNHILVTDLTPNVGLWWYFLIEMFDPFREFFLGVFWLHLGAYVSGLSIRIRRQPLFVATTMLGVFAIFKPYPSISDASLFLSVLLLYRHIFPLMRYSFFAVAALFYATLLGPAFYYLWIYAGSGNANFFYAITLVWSLGLSVVLSDAIWATLRDEWEVDRPEMKGRDVKQI